MNKFRKKLIDFCRNQKVDFSIENNVCKFADDLIELVYQDFVLAEAEKEKRNLIEAQHKKILELEQDLSETRYKLKSQKEELEYKHKKEKEKVVRVFREFLGLDYNYGYEDEDEDWN
jgi:hypothetical protein